MGADFAGGALHHRPSLVKEEAAGGGAGARGWEVPGRPLAPPPRRVVRELMLKAGRPGSRRHSRSYGTGGGRPGAQSKEVCILACVELQCVQ